MGEDASELENILSVKIGDVEYRNPLFVGSGPASTNYEQYKKAWESGAGAIVTKTIMDNTTRKKSEDKREGPHTRRAIWSSNRTTVYNQGSTAKEMESIDEAVKDIEKALGEGIAIIPSIATKQVYTPNALTRENCNRILGKYPASVLKQIVGESLARELEQKHSRNWRTEYEKLSQRWTEAKLTPEDREILIPLLQQKLEGVVNLDKISSLMEPLKNIASKTKEAKQDYNGKLNIEVNLRYIIRSIERYFAKKYSLSGISNKVIDEYFVSRNKTRKVEVGNDELLVIDHYHDISEAVLRSIAAIGKLAKHYNLGAIAKLVYRSDIFDMIEAARAGSYVAVTLINTMKTPPRIRDMTDEYPSIVKSKEYQVSGAAIRELSRETIYRVHKRFPDMPIIASGGVAVELQRRDPVEQLERTVNKIAEIQSRYATRISNSAISPEEILKEALKLGSEYKKGASMVKSAEKAAKTLDGEIENLQRNIKRINKMFPRESKHRRRFESLQKGLKLFLARQDVVDRLYLGASAVQLTTAVLAPPGYESIKDIGELMKLEVELGKAMMVATYIDYVTDKIQDEKLKRAVKKKRSSIKGELRTKFEKGIIEFMRTSILMEEVQRSFKEYLSVLSSFYEPNDKSIFTKERLFFDEVREYLQREKMDDSTVYKRLHILREIGKDVSKMVWCDLYKEKHGTLPKRTQYGMKLESGTAQKRIGSLLKGILEWNENTERYLKYVFQKDWNLNTDSTHSLTDVELAAEGSGVMYSASHFTVENLTGLAESYTGSKNQYEEITAFVDKDKCVGCGDCYNNVHYCDNIIAVPKENDEKENIKIGFITEGCDGCGTCSTFCDYEAIKMVPKSHLRGTNTKEAASE